MKALLKYGTPLLILFVNLAPWTLYLRETVALIKANPLFIAWLVVAASALVGWIMNRKQLNARIDRMNFNRKTPKL